MAWYISIMWQRARRLRVLVHGALTLASLVLAACAGAGSEGPRAYLLVNGTQQDDRGATEPLPVGVGFRIGVSTHWDERCERSGPPFGAFSAHIEKTERCVDVPHRVRVACRGCAAHAVAGDDPSTLRSTHDVAIVPTVPVGQPFEFDVVLDDGDRTRRRRLRPVRVVVPRLELRCGDDHHARSVPCAGAVLAADAAPWVAITSHNTPFIRDLTLGGRPAGVATRRPLAVVLAGSEASAPAPAALAPGTYQVELEHGPPAQRLRQVASVTVR